MPAQCWSSVGGCRARITKLDSCGRPLPPGTECGYAVTKGFTTIEFSPEISEGEEIEQRNACGEICVTDRNCDELRWISVEITFCEVNPDVFSMITGWDTVLDYKGDAVGIRVADTIDCEGGYALEVWSRIPNKSCAEGASEGQWGYFLLPYVSAGVIGDYTIENEALTFTFTGRTKAGSGWGVGPWDVDQHDADGTPGPLLTPIGENEHKDMHITYIRPPEPTCECLPMPDWSPGSPGDIS